MSSVNVVYYSKGQKSIPHSVKMLKTIDLKDVSEI